MTQTGPFVRSLYSPGLDPPVGVWVRPLSDTLPDIPEYRLPQVPTWRLGSDQTPTEFGGCRSSQYP